MHIIKTDIIRVGTYDDENRIGFHTKLENHSLRVNIWLQSGKYLQPMYTE